MLKSPVQVETPILLMGMLLHRQNVKRINLTDVDLILMYLLPNLTKSLFTFIIIIATFNEQLPSVR